MFHQLLLELSHMLSSFLKHMHVLLTRINIVILSHFCMKIKIFSLNMKWGTRYNNLEHFALVPILLFMIQILHSAIWTGCVLNLNMP
jgi:hypothetical protein